MQSANGLILHGIKTCDSCRKALRWLTEQGIEHQFRDLRQTGLQRAEAQRWLETFGWERLLNRQSSSWRQLPEQARAHVDAGRAIELLLENPTLMKRPLVEWSGGLLLGFDPVEYQQKLAATS